MSTSNSCKDDASKSNCECEVNDMLQNMSVVDNEVNIVSVCANCGKEGNDINNICNKCKQVKYCNAACKKKHRSKHKKECEEHVRLAAKHAAELHDIELFKQPPPAEDCPICFVRLPTLQTGYRYKSCCGKTICCGCSHAPVYDNQGNIVDSTCAFCRALIPKTDEESIEREKKRIAANDPKAIFNLGVYYNKGIYGFPQDHTKALELFHRAGELGCAESYNGIGLVYEFGKGVEVDKEKAKQYYELAAMGGDVTARYNLGNMERSLRHHIIAVIGGQGKSLETIQKMYLNGHATKDDYTKALRCYQEYLAEIKSVERDEAAAVNDRCRYY